MKLYDRGVNVLDSLTARDIGSKPLVFVAHSAGGLLVKQLLYLSDQYQGRGWGRIATNTRGVVFLATPHAGADLARWMKRLEPLSRPNPVIGDLQPQAEHIHDLNMWYRDKAVKLKIDTKVYQEGRKYKARFGHYLIVDALSSDPGISGVMPVTVDYDHINICKMRSRDQRDNDQRYSQIINFIRNCFEIGIRRPNDEANKTVLIARATDDLLDQAKSVASFLGQYSLDVRVWPIPENSVGESFKVEFREALTHSDLFVQLLGPYAGFGNLQAFQNDAARNAGIEIMQWRAGSVDVSAILDSEHRELVGGDKVVVSSLQEFKDSILNWARGGGNSSSTAMLLILADRTDVGIAEQIGDERLKSTHSIRIPLIDLKSSEKLKELFAGFKRADKFLFLYGDASAEWFDSIVERFRRQINGNRLTLRRTILCYGPPDSKPLSYQLVDARIIDCRKNWDFNRIRAEIAGITA